MITYFINLEPTKRMSVAVCMSPKVTINIVTFYSQEFNFKVIHG